MKKQSNLYTGSICLVLGLMLIGCSRASMSIVRDPSLALKNESTLPNDDYNPGAHETPNPTPTPGGGAGGSNPGGGTGGSNPGVVTNQCGGPADPMLYVPGLQIVKAQSAQRFVSYADCQATRAAYFGNATVCSKMVSATIMGCLATADLSMVVMETDFALPVFAATAQMEVPYDYYLNGVPNCEVAKNYLNSFSDRTVATSGNFSDTKAVIRADCIDATTVIIHILSIHP